MKTCRIITMYAAVAAILFTSTLVIAAPVTVYSCDFESGADVTPFSGVVSIQSTGGFHPYGFGDQYLWNTSTGNPSGATVLSLSNLPAHAYIEVRYDFCQIESWDGNGEGSGTKDFFVTEVDGSTVFDGPIMRAYDVAQMTDERWAVLSSISRDDPRVIVFGEQLVQTHWDPSPYKEAAYRMGYEELIPHVGDTLTVRWFASGNGWQGGNDESWAIDNVEVILHHVPEPATMGLLALGGLAVLKRRKA